MAVGQRLLRHRLQQVVAQVQVDQVGHALETAADDDVYAAVPHVDLLEIQQAARAECVLRDPDEAVLGEVEDLGGGVEAGEAGEGVVHALHGLLPALPLAEAALRTQAVDCHLL